LGRCSGSGHSRRTQKPGTTLDRMTSSPAANPLRGAGGQVGEEHVSGTQTDRDRLAVEQTQASEIPVRTEKRIHGVQEIREASPEGSPG
jgi:hypothetical protein